MKPCCMSWLSYLDSVQNESLCEIGSVVAFSVREFVCAQLQHVLGSTPDLNGRVFAVLRECCGLEMKGHAPCALSIWWWHNVEGTYQIGADQVFSLSARSCDTMTKTWLLRLVYNAADPISLIIAPLTVLLWWGVRENVAGDTEDMRLLSPSLV